MGKIFTTCLVMFVLLTGVSSAAVEKGIGSVISIQGDATAARAAAKPVKLNLKAPVFLNDKIITGAGAKLQIMFEDDSVISQGESSEMVIDKYVYNSGDKADNNCSVKFAKGMFRVVAGKITEMNPESFKVKTRMATIGIRGCELGFRLFQNREDIYILYLPEGKSILIDAIEGLNQGIDMAGINNSMTVVQSGVAVAIEPGAGLENREISANEAGQIFNDVASVTKSSGDDNTPSSEPSGSAAGMPEEVASIINDTNQDDDNDKDELPPLPSGPGNDAGAPSTAPPSTAPPDLAMGHPTLDTWEWGVWNDGTVFYSGNRYIGAAVLTAGEYAGIVAGATTYNLATPFPGGGAGAVVKDGSGYSASVTGSAMLNVIAGNGPGSWGGTFSLGSVGPGPAGDSLAFTVAGQAIDANGNLQLTAAGGYNLSVNGNTFTSYSTVSGGGNLVNDPATGNPIDGVAGEFHFTHVGGASADGAFGGDFF